MLCAWSNGKALAQMAGATYFNPIRDIEGSFCKPLTNYLNSFVDMKQNQIFDFQLFVDSERTQIVSDGRLEDI